MCGLSKKKMPYLHLIDEAIGLLNNEMRIIKLRIKYPEQFQQHANKLSLSPLHLTDKTNLINIMEIVSGLFLSKRIIYQNGKPVHLTDLGKAFEWLFNIKLGDYHQKYMDVIKRKPTKLTEFLNELVNLIRKEHENKGYR
ncbi:RteC domain-containing protein [Bacteroides uniformis]|uniref:RteC domain-containing protein n=1 Tax=Bacteroides TaxID=816 RepID=UPI003144DA44